MGITEIVRIGWIRSLLTLVHGRFDTFVIANGARLLCSTLSQCALEQMAGLAHFLRRF